MHATGYWLKQNKFSAIIVLSLIGFAGYTIYQITTASFQPNGMEFGEGYWLYQAKIWFNGFNWDISHPPYTVMIYGPIYPTIYALAIKLFGASIVVGRVICLIATAITAIYIYLITSLRSKKLIAIIAALFPFALPFYRDWIMFSRADVVAIMFAVIGLYLFLKYLGKNLEYLSI